MALGKRKTKFRMCPKYLHKRSEGLTWRRNKGSKYQMSVRSKKEMDRAFEKLVKEYGVVLKRLGG